MPVLWSLLVLGCADTPQPAIEPQWASLDDLWTTPNEFDGEYVVVTGSLKFGELPYFESVVTVHNVKPVIYVRFDNADVETAFRIESFQACVGEKVVRVYGRFRTWDEYESLLDGVYRVEAIKRRTPSAEDTECFVSSAGGPPS